jgi:hypothetical protein
VCSVNGKSCAVQAPAPEPPGSRARLLADGGRDHRGATSVTADATGAGPWPTLPHTTAAQGRLRDAQAEAGVGCIIVGSL